MHDRLATIARGVAEKVCKALVYGPTGNLSGRVNSGNPRSLRLRCFLGVWC